MEAHLDKIKDRHESQVAFSKAKLQKIENVSTKRFL